MFVYLILLLDDDFEKFLTELQPAFSAKNKKNRPQSATETSLIDNFYSFLPCIVAEKLDKE